jgi:hypothetical protein
MVAIGARDAAVAETEQRAGAALRELAEREGLSLSEAVEWCDDTVSVRGPHGFGVSRRRSRTWTRSRARTTSGLRREGPGRRRAGPRSGGIVTRRRPYVVWVPRLSLDKYEVRAESRGGALWAGTIGDVEWRRTYSTLWWPVRRGMTTGWVGLPRLRARP